MSEEYQTINQQSAADERIARFLRGLMTPDEAELFRENLKADKQLRERAIMQARLIKQMRQVGAEQQQRVVDAMKMVSPRVVADIAAGKGDKLLRPRKSTVRLVATWVSVAAVICIVVMVGLFAFTQNSQPSTEYALAVNQTQQVQHSNAHDNNGNAVKSSNQQLEELALLRGKVEMGIDLKESNARLEQILKDALKTADSPLTPFVNDIALTLSEGYLKVGDNEASARILDDLVGWQNEVLMAGE